MKIKLSDRADEKLDQLPDHVEDTLLNKVDDIQTALDLGASPAIAFDKYLSGPMHPILQINLGRDYRAWFIEGRHISIIADDTVLCLTILSKKEATKTAQREDSATLLREAL